MIGKKSQHYFSDSEFSSKILRISNISHQFFSFANFNPKTIHTDEILILTFPLM